MSNQLSEFLDLLENENTKKLKVKVSSKSVVNVNPLSFKQQKTLVTSGMDGIVGSMSFLKNLNDIILFNSDADDLKIYDRVPVILALKRQLSKKDIVKDDITISLDDLIAQFKAFELPEEETIEGTGFTVTLKIPTLKEENKHIAICIEDLKKIDSDNIGKNISLILSYEIPKFIKCIDFNGNKITIDQLSIGNFTSCATKIPLLLVISAGDTVARHFSSAKSNVSLIADVVIPSIVTAHNTGKLRNNLLSLVTALKNSGMLVATKLFNHKHKKPKGNLPLGLI